MQKVINHGKQVFESKFGITIESLTPARQRACLLFDRDIKARGFAKIGNGKDGTIHHRSAAWLVESGIAVVVQMGANKMLCTPDYHSKKTKAKAKPAKAKKAKAKANDKGRPCLCGCGGKVYGQRLFLQGHDAKLKSQLLKQVKGKGKLPANHPCTPDMQAMYIDRWNLAK